jgi:antitoxin PrlF
MPSLPEKKMLAVAKITAKGQTTIPQDVRAALHVAPGDLIAWEVGENGTATVRRVQALDIEYLRAVEGTLSEWAGPADEEAYREL